MQAIQLIEIPLSQGQELRGVEQGSKFLSKHLRYTLDKFGMPSEIIPLPKLTKDTNFDTYRSYSRFCEMNLQREGLNLFLGGDHSMALSTISAVLNRNPETLVIWIDAHGDINTPASSPSGNLHGMPLAYLLEAGGCRLPWMKQKMQPSQLIYLGIRDLDPGEQKLINELSILNFSAEEIRTIGVERIIAKIGAQLPDGSHRPLHISFDIDALDPQVAGATGIRVNGGLRKEEVLDLGKQLNKLGEIRSMDFAELNPNCAQSSEDLNNSLCIFSDFLLAAHFNNIERQNSSVFFQEQQL